MIAPACPTRPVVDSLVVRCAYCQAENVTAFDASVPLQFGRAAARDLSAVVADYAAMDPRRARRAALVVWLSFVAAVLVLGVTAYVVVGQDVATAVGVR